MRRPALLAILTLCAPAGAVPLPTHAPRIPDYDIRVTLDADAKTLAGSEHITWRNPAANKGWSSAITRRIWAGMFRHSPDAIQAWLK